MEGSKSRGRRRPLWRGQLAAAATEGAAPEQKAEVWPGWGGAAVCLERGEDSNLRRQLSGLSD